MVQGNWLQRLWWRISCYDGPRVRWSLSSTMPDEPRGREFGVNVELGVPTGEFDASMTGHPAEYGSWGGWITIWKWSSSLTFRGPILGKLPPDEDD